MVKSVVMNDRTRKKVHAALAKREAVLRAQVRSVIQGFTSALFVHGPGGLGKSHILGSELEALCGKAWQHHTAYTTPKALMLSLAEFPEQVHVFEDCEKLYKTDVACSILRAACGQPKKRDRIVTYETANEQLKVNFRGGIVIVSNENIGKGHGPLSAVASRFRPITWDLSTEERICRILDMADEGWQRGQWILTAKECREVASFLIDEMQSGLVNVPVDLRTYAEHALPAFAQFRTNKGGVGWKDILRSKLAGSIGKIEKRSERNQRLEQQAFALSKKEGVTAKQRAEIWKKQTGLGMTIYYRHLKMAQASEIVKS